MSEHSPTTGLGGQAADPSRPADGDIGLTVENGRVVAWTERAGAAFGLSDRDRGRRLEELVRPAREVAALAAELERQRQALADEAVELWQRAFHDPLTNLANRNLLHQRAASALERPGTMVALLLVELDGLKAINDALGHAVGDRLLVAVADRLRAATEGRGTVARPGGGFAVLLDDLAAASEADGVATTIVEALSAPFEIEPRVLVVAPRVGIVVVPEDMDVNVDTLLRNADVALYHARSGSRGPAVRFEETMHAAALHRLELEADLRLAVRSEQLLLHFQPIADLRSGRILGVEALVRWMHPTRGMVSPAEFIPLAEETGLVVALGEWVLREACRQAVAWHRSHPDLPPVSMAVNLAGSQLLLPTFAETLASILEETGLRAGDLVLEITETQIMTDVESILPNLEHLQRLGVRLSIDDFGTGYSSLSRLRNLPVDELKIDRSFVQGIHSATDDAPLVGAIVALAHRLGLHVVAEGVETAEQLDFLARAGCDRVQGFLLGRPAPADMIEDLIAQPILVLRLAAATAVLGDASGLLGIDIAEALAAVLADSSSTAETTSGLLELVARTTGLPCAYVTRIDWSRQEQTVTGVHGGCGIVAGDRFSWAGASTPDLYLDGRGLAGAEAYISVPMVDGSGGLIGTLCATGPERRTLSRTQLAAMEVLAAVLGEELVTDRTADTVRVPG